jgi:hypothetical protein
VIMFCEHARKTVARWWQQVSKNDLLKHLRANGCLLIREGKHEIWHNPSTGMTSPVPRHQTIDRILVRKDLP